MLNKEITEKTLDDVIQLISARFDRKPSVCLTGVGKAGKSSLFNAIYGKGVAHVSMRTDETTGVQTEELRFGIDFSDTPGIGTDAFSFEKVCKMGVFADQDVVIHALNGAAAISEVDRRIHDAVLASSASLLTVVNKCDLLSEQEQDEITESMKEKLGLNAEDFLFVSAREGTNVEALVGRILEALPTAIRDAFIAQQQVDVALKEKRIRSLIYSKATICAAVAAVPIPIADIFVISPIQVALVSAISCIYGIRISSRQAVELMATLGAGVGLRQVARQFIKLIPGYGSVIASGVAFSGTVALGEAANAWFKSRMDASQESLRELIDESVEQAKEKYAEFKEEVEGCEERLKALKTELDEGDISEDEYNQRIAALDETEK